MDNELIVNIFASLNNFRAKYSVEIAVSLRSAIVFSQTVQFIGSPSIFIYHALILTLIFIPSVIIYIQIIVLGFVVMIIAIKLLRIPLI